MLSTTDFYQLLSTYESCYNFKIPFYQQQLCSMNQASFFYFLLPKQLSWSHRMIAESHICLAVRTFEVYLHHSFSTYEWQPFGSQMILDSLHNDISIMIHNSNKIKVMEQQQNNLMVEVTITGGSVLKGRRLRATDLQDASQKFCMKDGIGLTFGIPSGKGQDWRARLEFLVARESEAWWRTSSLKAQPPIEFSVLAHPQFLEPWRTLLQSENVLQYKALRKRKVC